MKNLLFLFALMIQVSVQAQIPNGSTAPDFTLTDYYGTEHNLYSYLEDGKTVFVEIFAAHCPSCWSYHQTHTLKNLYNDYGPEGSNELMVLALEHDQYNDSNAFIGNHEPWVTQGNWLEGTPYPIFDVENPDRGVFEDYNVTFYPVIYKVCPDGIVERVMTSEDEAQLYEKVQVCQDALSLDEAIDLGELYVDQASRTLYIAQFQSVNAIEVINLHGQLVTRIGQVSQSRIDLGDMTQGIYYFVIQTDNGSVIKKLYLR